MKHFLVFLFVIFCAGIVGHFVFADQVERVSVTTSGTQGNGTSFGAQMSSDNEYIVFTSSASNLVDGDTNGVADVFVYSRDTGVIERVSLDSLGTQGNGAPIYEPAISADGRYVAFDSEAINFDLSDTNGLSDIFVYDRQTDTIERVSVDDVGTEADGASYIVSMSSDGRYVAFNSDATNLVAGDTNGVADVFVYDRQTDTIERVSVDDVGTEADLGTINYLDISDDGQYVTFDSDATNLVAGDTNGVADVFVYDRQADTIERVSVDDVGTEADGGSLFPSLSGDGRYVAFLSLATNLVSGDTNGTFDIFVYDRQTDTIERVSVNSQGQQANNASSYYSSISFDGRYVIFNSIATNLVANDTNGKADIFVRDRTLGTTERISVGENGVEANDHSFFRANVSTDGRYVLFPSLASNLVSGDTNAAIDVFVYDREYEEVEAAVVSGGVNSSGFLQPHISLENYATQTSSQTVNLVAHIPVTTTFYEISNTSDFANRQIFIRDGLEKILQWDICNNLKTCEPGQKKIYARFYNQERMISEQILEINYLQTRECPYFKQYLRMGSNKNNPDEVIKMQAFLNAYMGENLSVDGYFGRSTDRAVRRFQEKYPDQIIRPWPTLDRSTGWWYITTSGYANVLVGC